MKRDNDCILWCNTSTGDSKRGFEEDLVSLPNEVWMKILTTPPTKTTEIYPLRLLNIEFLFRCASCVSRCWSKFMSDLVCSVFKHEFAQSDWLLGHFTHLLELKLEPQHSKISDQSISKMTNLTSLEI